ncbi:Mrp/NBP35 family ATP-binding protein [Paracrocinitomix mangrovi]|uniref:Mrp/NBP35 family ATP-binding protein n=1 Tax=Paracrocinitomix mangrovi TaxID=2862509 RepID=UPI001EDA5346|nr:Mrp/NBP35 family ATP-binding protein [Paracrocinitomix mangrovi]UKN03516.1 Mrp/NBP35 family ATP-binding protein [Paracrocinitomix mangrovi]
MEITVDAVKEALKKVIEPDLKKDIITLDLVDSIEIDGNKIKFNVKIYNPAMHAKKRMQEALEFQLERAFGKDVEAEISMQPLPKDKEPEVRSVLSNVQNIIAVASGKGGVGKSTITANLAAGLAKMGYKVGLVDADIYGPSMPTMFDVVGERPQGVEKDGKTLIKPIEAHGVKILSIGFFADPEQAVVWRGPMATKALNQMFKDADWGELDYMIVDLPPGTGDVHLTLVQNVPLTGVVVVSTPQEVALADARKGINMFRMDSLKVPVLGIVENMAWFTPEELPDNKYYIFGQDGAKMLSETMNVPLLAQIPLIQSVRESGDVGRPAVLQDNTLSSSVFDDFVRKFVTTLKVTV